MFRKLKRKGMKAGLRRRNEGDEADDVAVGLENENDDDNSVGDKDDDTKTSELISEARKRLKTTNPNSNTTTVTTSSSSKGKSSATMHTFGDSSTLVQSSSTANNNNYNNPNAELATRAALHLPSKEEMEAAKQTSGTAGRGADGIYRNKQANKFLAGPIKASQNIRVTARFDYQPDICKDYKDTGFCGFGDTCIYLHDRGDTLTGWQLEAQWEEEQRKKKEQQEQELNAFMDAAAAAGRGKGPKTSNNNSQPPEVDTQDGLPFACHLCREYFKDPIVTNCQHYFCEACIMDHVRQGGENSNTTTSTESNKTACPICHKDTHGVFHQPTKLLAKKRKVLGSAQNRQEDSWKLYAEAFHNNK